MQERVERRLGELKTEYESGEARLAELEAERAAIEQAQLSLGSIIDVLEDLLAPEEDAVGEEASPDAAGDEESNDGVVADADAADSADDELSDDDEVSTDDAVFDADDGEVNGVGHEDGSPATQASSYSAAWVAPVSDS